MHASFYSMSIVQVRRVPEDLHEAMKARARSQGLSLNDFLLELMKKEMALPAMSEWLQEVRARPSTVKGFSMSDLMDDVRGEFDASS